MTSEFTYDFSFRENIWVDLFDYINQYHCCKTTKLNPDSKPERDIYIAKICNSQMINNFFDARDRLVGDVDILDINSDKSLLAFIPNTSRPFVNLFCCGFTMEYIHSKFDDFGLAIEGCFNIEPITVLPRSMQAIDPINNDMIKMNGISKPEDSFLIIDDHRISKIVDGHELKSYEPYGVNVQYIQGERLYTRGEPFMNFIDMKAMYNRKFSDLPENILGSEVSINYRIDAINIMGRIFYLSELNSELNFVNSKLFISNSNPFVFATDFNDNSFILHFREIDTYSLMLLLRNFSCKDAIILCDSIESSAIWKESGYNKYNKTDFIGNPERKTSSVITFSG